MYSNAVELLKELVSFQTVNPPGNEKALANRIAQMGSEMGVESKVLELNDNTRANVLLHIKGKDTSAPSLMFNGHLDVVPATGLWKNDPFVLHKKDGRLYGRGTCDMKGGIACMLAALSQLLEENFEPKGDLYLLFVADEECDDIGTIQFLKNAPKIDYCVIGEPTMREICVAHRGVCRYKITVEGSSCHAGNPDNGVNAVEKMAQFVLEVEKLNKSLKNTKHPILPPATVAVTTIKGGEKHNVIPDICEIVFDWRTLPSQTEEAVCQTLTDILNRLSNNKSLFKYSFEKIIYLSAGSVDTENNFVKQAEEVYCKTFERPAEVQAFTACCEQSIYTDAGILAIICGPGSIKQAHTANEYVEEQQITDTVLFYKNLILKILG